MYRTYFNHGDLKYRPSKRDLTSKTQGHGINTIVTFN